MATLILTYMSGPDDGRSEHFEVPDSGSAVTIGRLAQAGICIPNDPEASRQHARLFFRDCGWWLEDLGSANGTFIGEFAASRKIASATKLTPGQIFRVGLTRFRLETETSQVGVPMTMAQRTPCS